MENSGGIFGHYFLNRTTTAQKIEARIDIWDCLKYKSFTHQKNQETTHRMDENLCLLFIK
jgi:hypothetical protein